MYFHGLSVGATTEIVKERAGICPALELLCALCSACLADSYGLAYVAHLEAGKALDRDVLAELADDGRDELRHGHGLVLDEGLLIQADLLVELAHLAFDDLLDHRSRFARLGSLRAIDVLFLLKVLGSDILLADELGVAGRDVHGNVMHQGFEVVGTGHEIALAVYFHQHTDLSPGVDVARHRAFAGDAGSLLRGRGHALLAQDDNGAFHVALGFGQGLLAVHHGSVGLLAELFYLCGTNVHGCSTHLWKYSCSVVSATFKYVLDSRQLQNDPRRVAARVMKPFASPKSANPGPPRSAGVALLGVAKRLHFPPRRAGRLCPAPLPC